MNQVAPRLRKEIADLFLECRMEALCEILASTNPVLQKPNGFFEKLFSLRKVSDPTIAETVVRWRRLAKHYGDLIESDRALYHGFISKLIEILRQRELKDFAELLENSPPSQEKLAADFFAYRSVMVSWLLEGWCGYGYWFDWSFRRKMFSELCSDCKLYKGGQLDSLKSVSVSIIDQTLALYYELKAGVLVERCAPPETELDGLFANARNEFRNRECERSDRRGLLNIAWALYALDHTKLELNGAEVTGTGSVCLNGRELRPEVTLKYYDGCGKDCYKSFRKLNVLPYEFYSFREPEIYPPSWSLKGVCPNCSRPAWSVPFDNLEGLGKQLVDFTPDSDHWAGCKWVGEVLARYKSVS